MNVSPGNALAFDDAPAGVLAARSAGLRCVGVSNNGTAQSLLAAGAERVIAGFAGLTPDDLLARNGTPSIRPTAAPWINETHPG
jgi:beta-phosphoglucomutase-like phosphatase (HAD superfamily)